MLYIQPLPQPSIHRRHHFSSPSATVAGAGLASPIEPSPIQVLSLSLISLIQELLEFFPVLLHLLRQFQTAVSLFIGSDFLAPHRHPRLAMPRKPRGRRVLFQPITFSSYARSLARNATAYMLKHKECACCHSHKPSPRKCSENEIPDQLLEENDHESESSGEEVSEGEIQADFAFFDPKPDDFHGVKTLLQAYLDDKQWALSSFVDVILAQTTVGTVVKLEDDEDNGSFAIATALNLGMHKEKKCMKEVKDYLIKSCQDDTIANQLKELVEHKPEHVGLLVSQRVVNLPPQLLPHLYDALFNEIQWATEDEPTEELRESFRFKHYILLSRVYMKKTQSKEALADNNEDDIIYVKAEDELLHKLCSWCFTFPMQSQQPADQELKNHRLSGLVMAIKAEKIAKFRKQLRSLIDDES
ncbi:hypothetical protein V2J09_017358 [Rumex salicifolius]